MYILYPGESKKGCKSYKATVGDKEVFLTTWSIDVNGIKAKCPINCDNIYNDCSREHGDITALVKAFKDRANFLIQNIDHSNLVRYLDVDCTESDKILTVHLVQDYVKNAMSVSRLSNDGVLADLAPIAQWTLKVIAYLNKMKPKIYHGYVTTGSIFIQSSGAYRVSDFNLIPYLMYLKGTKNVFITDDVHAVGLFIKRRFRTVRQCSKEFIEKCCSDGGKRSFAELLSHQFLSNVHIGEATTTYNGPLLNQFEVIGVLGRGIDGWVIKVRQPANGELFALKIIKIPIASKGRYTKAQRESDLIPKLDHKHVVKYYASWEQTIDVNELKISFDDDEECSTSDSDSDSTSASTPIK